MATYILLVSFTEQGLRTVKDTTKRAEVFREMSKQFGVTVKDIYWTLGRYDLVITVDAPDAATITAAGLTLGMAGNVRTQTLTAFSAAEMGGILDKVR
ncbi:GYD domain-containing protein [Neisseriaceae bacterium JH1-16]|nr:GYD domain-containing protein [Neisseriaceae bacterium JH1-16]